MVDTQQLNSKNSSYVADLDGNFDLNSTALDLSFKRTSPSPKAINVSSSSPTSFSLIPCNKIDKQQPIQQSNTELTSMKLYMEINKAELIEDRWELLQVKKQKTNDDDQINRNQLSNIPINGQIKEQTNSNQRWPEQLKSSQVDYINNYMNINQANTEEINSDQINSSRRNSPLSTGQSILHQYPILTTNSLNLSHLPANHIPIPNANQIQPSPLPMTILPVPQNSESIKKINSIKKAPRPFKVYPKDPLDLSSGDIASDKEYKHFRDSILENVRHTENENGNSKMRRISNKNEPGSPTSSTVDDEKKRAYLERRRKNNAAAKRSRDARRAKEDEIAIRAAYLESQNTQLKQIIGILAQTVKEQNIPFDWTAIKYYLEHNPH